MSATFFAWRHPVSCFSRAMASLTSRNGLPSQERSGRSLQNTRSDSAEPNGDLLLEDLQDDVAESDRGVLRVEPDPSSGVGALVVYECGEDDPVSRKSGLP